MVGELMHPQNEFGPLTMGWHVTMKVHDDSEYDSESTHRAGLDKVVQ